MKAQAFSVSVESLLVERDLRQMAKLRAALEPGYVLRAARMLDSAQRVLIATGFPVGDSFETDGPLGALALYAALDALGHEVWLACARPLAAALGDDYRIHELRAFDHDAARAEARAALQQLAPDIIVCIERPGLAADGRYYNMRGVDISERCAIFDYYVRDAACPTIAIGDGGNEIGMGKLRDTVAELSITGAETGCDELLVADVSNWGAYGLIAMLDHLAGRRLLDAIDHDALLAYLSERGSVDGVTGENTLSEDGLPAAAGAELLARLQALAGAARRAG